MRLPHFVWTIDNIKLLFSCLQSGERLDFYSCPFNSIEAWYMFLLFNIYWLTNQLPFLKGFYWKWSTERRKIYGKNRWGDISASCWRAHKKATSVAWWWGGFSQGEPFLLYVFMYPQLPLISIICQFKPFKLQRKTSSTLLALCNSCSGTLDFFLSLLDWEICLQFFKPTSFLE